MLSIAGPNVLADGSEYLSGGLLFGWGPSEEALTTARLYEKGINGLVTKLLTRQVSYYVFWVIWTQALHRTLTYKPWVPDPEERAALGGMMERQDAGPYVKAVELRDACPPGTLIQNREKYLARSRQGQPLDPDPEDLATGLGSDAIVRITPGFLTGPRGWSKYTGPGFHPDEILFHETVHALSIMSGVQATAWPGPPDYDNLEEFTACVVSNMYISQENLYSPGHRSKLREGHGVAYDPDTGEIRSNVLPDALANSRAFAARHAPYLKAVARNHPGLIAIYRTMTWVPFNPFLYL